MLTQDRRNHEIPKYITENSRSSRKFTEQPERDRGPIAAVSKLATMPDNHEASFFADPLRAGTSRAPVVATMAR